MNKRHLLLMSPAAMVMIVLIVGGSAWGQEYDTGAVETCTGESIQLSGDEKRVLDLHNWTRAEYGLQPLCLHSVLTEAARTHSQEMLDVGYFGHESSDGRTAEGRVEGFGYTSSGYSYWAIGENIGWGTGYKGLPDHRFEEWMASSDHRPNILSEDFDEIGIGVRAGRGYVDGTMYTVDFGTRR
jgi:uncharacterized protein YkwD